jgi:hypothetical protein
MKPAPMTAKRKAELKRAGALDAFIATGAGPFSAYSLSRSYGVELSEVVRILKERGKYHG